MKLNLEKWLNNKTDANFKRIFNDNVEKINNVLNYFIKKDKATNNRINNLILRAGGPDNNQVIDACVDLDGEVHATLKDRLDADYKKSMESITIFEMSLITINQLIGSLENKLNVLYSQNEETVTIYVSSERGNDDSGDGTVEKPFKTIQKAVYQIPLISSGSYIIEADRGYYREDVVVSNLSVESVSIVSSNMNTLAANVTDTGVYVRSIHFDTCRTYCSAKGFTQIDVQNSNAAEVGYFIYGERTNYVAIDRCPAIENTKSLGHEYRAYWYDATNGNIYNSQVNNQNIAVSATFGSIVRVSKSTEGVDNQYSIHSVGSIVFTGETANINGSESKSYGGQIY